MTKVMALILSSFIAISVFAEQDSKTVAQSPASISSSTKLNMTFMNEDLLKIIETYSKASGQKFIVDPGVRGKITIMLPEPVTLDEAFNQLSSALAINGFSISKQGDTMIVKSARNIQRDFIEVSTEVPSMKPERMYTWIYKVQNLTVESINRDLRILPSKDGEMVAYSRTNQLIITDWSSNINRIAKLINILDKPMDAKTSKLVELSNKEREQNQRRTLQMHRNFPPPAESVATPPSISKDKEGAKPTKEEQ